MQPYAARTPFGMRPLSSAQIAAQREADAAPHQPIADKWAVFRDICVVRERLGVSERALTVLDALLSFHPDATLSADALIVWPSNAQLQLRAHGMAPATLRRHLSALVEAGLVVRRDSPNGKRYARKTPEGDVEQAFGFDLSPLRSRAQDIAAQADLVRSEERARRVAREQLSLLRRDVAKIIEAAAEDGGVLDTDAALARYATFATLQPRRMALPALQDAVSALKALADELYRAVAVIADTNLSGKESQNERHIQNSKNETLIESEPSIQKMQAEPVKLAPGRPGSVEAFPLGFVLSTCPMLSNYARSGIVDWREFIATAAFVRPMLGISSSAWDEAKAAMGEKQAALVIAAMLERSEAISNTGGYLRSLTRKAEARQFSVGPMLMALAASRRKDQQNIA